MTVKSSHQLKKLQTELKSAENDVSQFAKQMACIKTDFAYAKMKVSEIKQDIKKASKNEVIISEHALLRYFERILGFDLEKIRQEILTPDILNLIDFAKSGKVPFQQGHHLVCRDRIIVTIE